MKVRISKKELPDWVTVSEKKMTPLQKYLNFIYNKILNFSKTDRIEAIRSYNEAKAKHPSWETSFNEVFTDKMIKIGYNKNPEDVENKTGLTYRELINAFYYKAYPEYHDKLSQYEKERIATVLSKTDKKLKLSFIL